MSLPVTWPPLALQEYATVCLGLKLLAVTVAVTGSPTITSLGCTEQLAAGAAGGAPPQLKTSPVRRRTPLNDGRRRSEN